MDNAKEHTPDPTTTTATTATAATTQPGILSDNDTPPAERGHGLTKEAVERLGRERPPLLGSMVAEVGFVTAIVLSMMMSEFFISGFNIALPKVAEALSMPESLRTWPAAVINLTTASFLLPSSRLCDRYGPRLVFLGGHAWLTLWSLVCGFSADAVMLIVCRAMQGLGAAAFMPAGLALLAQTYRPGPRKNLIFSLYGAFACIGFYFGILISAVSVGLLHWRWYFWIGTCLCLAVVVLGICFVPRDLRADDPDVSMDWLGMATIAPGLVLVVFALTDGGHAPDGWRTPYIYVTFVVGALLLCAAVYVQGWVSEQPLLPAEVFRPKYLKRLMFGLFCAYGVFSLFLFYASF